MKLFHIAMSGRRGRPISFKGRRRRWVLLSPPKISDVLEEEGGALRSISVQCSVALTPAPSTHM